MAPRSSKGSLTCTATSSLVLLCLGLAVIAVGILVPGLVHNKLQEGVGYRFCLSAGAESACMQLGPI